MNRATTLLGSLAVIAIAIVFIVNFQPGGGSNQLKPGEECAAEVLGSCIKRQHFWATYQMLFGSRDGKQQQEQARKQVMDALVERELLLSEAKRLGVSISEEELTAEIKAGRVYLSVPAQNLAAAFNQSMMMRRKATLPKTVFSIKDQILDKKTKQFSPEEYKKTVQRYMGVSEQEFREFQRAEIIAQRMRELIMSRVRISESEAFDAYSAQETTAKVKSVRFRREYYVPRGVDRTQAAMDAWAEKNGAEITKEYEGRKASLTKGCREVSHIQIAFKGTTDADRKAARDRLEAIRKHVHAGGDFAQAAKDYSDDRDTAPDGGRLGCMTEKDVTGKFQPFFVPVFGPEKDGAVSDIVESEVGVHIVRVDKILNGADAEKALKDRVTRVQYVTAESRRLAMEAAKEVQAAVKGGKSIEDALKDHLAKLPKVAPRKAELPKVEEPKEGGDAPSPKEGKKDGEKKDEPKKEGAPKKDEPKKEGDAPKDEPKKEGDAPKDEPKKDEPKKDGDATADVDPFEPKVETSGDFTVVEEPFQDLEPGESAAAVAFGLEKPGSVAERLIPAQGGGLILMVLESKTSPSDDQWQKERGDYIDSRRIGRQLDGLAEYMRRVRTQHTADIKPNPEFFPKPEGSASAANSGAPPPPEE